MNERIEAYLKQHYCRDYFNSYGETVEDDHYFMYREEVEGFIELIVQECCKTLEEMHMWQSVNNQNYPSAWHNAVDQGIDNIKEHFGVEL